jgi:hypothetical protein
VLEQGIIDALAGSALAEWQLVVALRHACLLAPTWAGGQRAVFEAALDALLASGEVIRLPPPPLVLYQRRRSVH